MKIYHLEQSNSTSGMNRETGDYSFQSPSTGNRDWVETNEAAYRKSKVQIDDVVSNKILASLPLDDIERLLPKMELIRLGDRENINGSHPENSNLYFLTDGIVSSLSALKDGSMAEIGVIGNEGIVGLSGLLNNFIPEHWAKVVVAGSALKVKADVIKREFSRGGHLQQLLLNYTGSYLNQVSQRSICNSQHKIDMRFAAWLLMIHDRMGSDLLPLTHEEMACCLGTRRSSITVAAIALQQRHIIRYIRGQIRILDRPELENASCECYGILDHKRQKSAMNGFIGNQEIR